MGLDLFSFFVASFETWDNWQALEFVSSINFAPFMPPKLPDLFKNGSPLLVPFVLLAVIIAVFRKKRVRKTSEDAE
ncbi:MAG: hypothetical protein AAGE61_17465 [Pseudomonadota bacterium]